MENSLSVPTTIKHVKKRAFLMAYSECGTVTRAAEIADIERCTHYQWLKDDPIYAKACEAAYEQAGERLEQEARRRAVEGTQKPVWYQGEQCGVVNEYSDVLLMFLLKGAKPDKYKDRVSNEVTVTPLQVDGEISTLRDLKQKSEKQSIPELVEDIEPAE